MAVGVTHGLGPLGPVKAKVPPKKHTLESSDESSGEEYESYDGETELRKVWEGSKKKKRSREDGDEKDKERSEFEAWKKSKKEE